MSKLPYELDSFEAVEALVSGEINENLHLDYKSGRLKKKDMEGFKTGLAKDVAAFANADGGAIVIGVREVDNVPVEIDGVDESCITRGQIDESIRSKVTPVVYGQRITRLVGPDGKVVIVIHVPASQEPPHQGPDKKYHRRFECTQQALAHHEVEDLRRRRGTLGSLVVVSVGVRGLSLSTIDIRNPGKLPATDVTFGFSGNMPWPPNFRMPKPLAEGIANLAPGQLLRFRYLPFSQLLSNAASACFSVDVEYSHPHSSNRVGHTWQLDFDGYHGALSVPTDEDQWRADLLKEMKGLAESTKRLADAVTNIGNTLVGANGLALSVWTLRNLRSIALGGPLERLSARQSWQFFETAFSIDEDLAFRLEDMFSQPSQPVRSWQDVAAVPGVTPELLVRLKETLELASESIDGDP